MMICQVSVWNKWRFKCILRHSFLVSLSEMSGGKKGENWIEHLQTPKWRHFCLFSCARFQNSCQENWKEFLGSGNRRIHPGSSWATLNSSRHWWSFGFGSIHSAPHELPPIPRRFWGIAWYFLNCQLSSFCTIMEQLEWTHFSFFLESDRCSLSNAHNWSPTEMFRETGSSATKHSLRYKGSTDLIGERWWMDVQFPTE